MEPLEDRLLLSIMGGGGGALNPEVVVEYSGVNIDDDDNTPNVADGTDFGSIQQGNPGPTHTFTVRNTGAAMLTLGSVFVPAGFLVTDSLVDDLAPGEEDAFTVQLSSRSPGTRSGDIVFSTNDNEEDPFNFRIIGVVTPMPEILVLYGSLTILDGDVTPSLMDGTDFGNATAGQTGPSRTFTVRNTGSATLTLGALLAPSGFLMTEGLADSIAPGSSDAFTVQLDAATAGTYGGDISFSNNDADENPFHFQVTGVVTPPPAPEIVVEFFGVDIADGDNVPGSDDGTDFGGVMVGRTAPSRTFTVRNTGNATLTLGGLSVPAGYVVTEGLSATLAPGKTDSFTVRMDSDSVGVHSGEITFSTNDSDENPFHFRTTGEVTAVPYSHMALVADSAFGESLGGFSADGLRIAYYQMRSATPGDSDIWVMNANGSGMHRITSGYGAFKPVFLPDGRISYVRANGADWDIWLANANGSQAHMLLGGPLNQAEHSWDSKGKKILFAGQYAVGGGSEIWSAKADGTGLARLTNHLKDGFSQSAPLFSSSGGLIAYASQATDGSDAHVWVMKSNGRSKRQVTFGTGQETPVFWWPDGSAIAFTRPGADGDSELWVVHLATGVASPLLALKDGEIVSAALSGSGGRLALTVQDSIGTHIWTLEGSLFGGKMKAEWKDADGDAVALSLGGPGTGIVFNAGLSGEAPDIVLSGTTVKSQLTLKVKKARSGNGQTALGDVTAAAGSLKNFSAAATVLAGDVSIAGILGSLTLGNISSGSISLGGVDASGLSMSSFKAGRVNDLMVSTAGGIRSISLADWQGGNLSAGWVGSIATKANTKTGSRGHFGADVTLTGAAVPARKPVLGSAKIAGDLLSGATWDIQSGVVGKIAVTGTADHCIIRSGGDIQNITLGASNGSDFGAGVTLDLLSSNRHASPGDPLGGPTGKIGSFTVKGFKVAKGQPKPRFFADSNLSAAAATVKILNWDGTGGLFTPAGSLHSVTLKETEPGFSYSAGDFVHLV
jgi:Tol biopolymer transport system component